MLFASAAHAATLDALWQFEETSGSPITDTVASLTQTVSLANLNVTGQFGSGIDFSTDGGQAAYTATTTSAGHAATQPTGDFSILVWIRPTAGDLTDPYTRFIDTSSNTGGITSGYRLMTGSDDASERFRFLGDSGANNMSMTHGRYLQADRWTLLAVRYDTDGNATLNVLYNTDSVDASYVGSNSETMEATGPIQYTAGEDTNFGAMDDLTLTSDFNGRMDDAAFFTGLLTDAEIATAFNSGAAALIPEPATMSLLALGGIAMLRRRKK